MLEDKKLFDFAEAIRNTGRMNEAWQLINREMDQFGFTGGTYILYTELRNGSISDDMLFFSSYDADFLQTYIGEGMADHDYAVLHCAHSDRPARWSDIKDKYRTPKRGVFNEISSDYGLREGFVIPIKDRRGLLISGIGFCMSNEQEAEATRLLTDQWDSISQLCLVFDEAVKTSGKLRGGYGLTSREIDCIRLVCQGKYNKEIADILKLADKTVENYLQNAAQKLRARNKHHLAAKAAVLGFAAP
ncbi:autoinducer binding domain-containing protein [Amorphus sp. 3PC139-8]|uniref:helix-turn-helix transcriptional regulator n=1 Tax=Amorphus sp. 3PC139-8 TaxID=2735676 RepID=UPI00345D39D2